MVLLNSFSNKPKLEKTKIFALLETIKKKKRELYELSQAVLGVSATQVSVERAFSG